MQNNSGSSEINLASIPYQSSFINPISRFFVKCPNCEYEIEAEQPYYSTTGNPVIYEISNDILGSIKFGIYGNSNLNFNIYFPNYKSISEYITHKEIINSGRVITIKYGFHLNILDIQYADEIQMHQSNQISNSRDNDNIHKHTLKQFQKLSIK